MDISRISQEISSQFARLSQIDQAGNQEAKEIDLDKAQSTQFNTDSADLTALDDIKEIVKKSADMRAKEVQKIKQALSEGMEFRGSDIAAAMMDSEELVEFFLNE